MSIEAISWVFKQDIKPSSLKLLLIALANNASSIDWKCWPSVDYLVKMTNLNRKTVISGIAELEKRGYLSWTGYCIGKTKSIKVYYFEHPDASQEAVPKTEQLKQSQKITEAVPKTDGSSTENGKPPAPPILKNLKGTNKRNHNKTHTEKLSLAQWEESQGSMLRVEMFSTWIKDARADARLLPPLIEQFREKMQAQGNVYADFKAAFLVYMRNGWLKKTMAEIRIKADLQASSEARQYTPGSSL